MNVLGEYVPFIVLGFIIIATIRYLSGFYAYQEFNTAISSLIIVHLLYHSLFDV